MTSESKTPGILWFYVWLLLFVLTLMFLIASTGCRTQRGESETWTVPTPTVEYSDQ